MHVEDPNQADSSLQLLPTFPGTASAMQTIYGVRCSHAGRMSMTDIRRVRRVLAFSDKVEHPNLVQILGQWETGGLETAI